jgi:hypothetical protein
MRSTAPYRERTCHGEHERSFNRDLLDFLEG